MARYAMVQDASGVVVNVIEWDGNTETWQPPAGHTMVLDEPPSAGPGATYDGEKFIPPPAWTTPGAPA
jgi:hypothetical protein